MPRPTTSTPASPAASPFPVSAERALQAHGSFAASAMGVGARRVVDGKAAQPPVSAPAQACNNVVQPAAAPAQAAQVADATDTPREKHRMPCPHCEQPSVIRTSMQMSRVTRECTFCCTNPECGHTFVALIEVVRTLSPSATPDPSIHLPLSSHVRRDLLRVQIESAAQAQHKTAFTRPVTGDLFGAQPPPKPS